MRDKAKHKSSFYKLLFFHGVALLFLNACSLLPNFEDLTCPNPQPAELEAIQRVFFSPFTQQRFSSESDTVSLENFRYNIELAFKPYRDSIFRVGKEDFLLAGCNYRFDAINISSIMIINKESFSGILPNNDISFLFELEDGRRLSQFRNFSQMENFLSLKLKVELSKAQSLKTDLIINLTDGTLLKINSTSPVLVQ